MTKRESIKKALSVFETNKQKFRSTGFKNDLIKKLLKQHIEAQYHYYKWCSWSAEKINQHVNEYELDLNSLIHTIKQYQKVKNAILNNRLVLNCVSNNGLNWEVRYVLNNQMQGISLTILKTLSGYRLNYETRAFCVGCYGTSRPLELILGFGHTLGLTFKQIPQNQQVL